MPFTRLAHAASSWTPYGNSCAFSPQTRRMWKRRAGRRCSAKTKGTLARPPVKVQEELVLLLLCGLLLCSLFCCHGFLFSLPFFMETLRQKIHRNLLVV